LPRRLWPAAAVGRQVDENMSGSIDFSEFLKVIENQKEVRS
jgi:hypothetical protein